MLAPLLAIASILQQAPVPWVLVDRPEPRAFDRYTDVVRPRIERLGANVLLAAYEHVGHYDSHYGTYVVRSDDDGRTWKRTVRLEAPRYASLFVAGDKACLLGIDGTGRGARGRVTLTASTDGVTWTGGGGADRVRLRGDDVVQAQNPVLTTCGGRVWRVLESPRTIFGKEGAITDITYQLMVASAPLGGDLLDPASWRWSANMPISDIGAKRYVELVAVPTRASGPRILVVDEGDNTHAILDVVHDGWRIEWRRTEAPLRAPAAVADGTLTWDEASSAYWAVTVDSTLTTEDPTKRPARNAVTLRRSADLNGWQRAIVVEDLRAEPVHLKDAAWSVHGDDMLVLLAGTFPPEAKDGVWADAVALVRIPRFRDLEQVAKQVATDPR